jgi:hypothetical protein
MIRDEDFIKGEALLIQHCAVMGRVETRVRAYQIGPVEPYAQYPVSVNVYFFKPRERHFAWFCLVPDNLRYLVIEVAGQVVYDSRTDVPCDMEVWTATNRRFTGQRPLATHPV